VRRFPVAEDFLHRGQSLVDVPSENPACRGRDEQPSGQTCQTMIKEVTRIVGVWKSGMKQNSDEAYEAQCDMYGQPWPDSSYFLDESYPSAPLDDRVELG
jgi:hypothetical protein